MSISALACIFIVSAILSLFGTGALLPLLRKYTMVDSPNERSSHTKPTLHGGGLALISVSALAIGILSFNPFDWSVEEIGSDGLWLIFGMFSLGVVSWFDDIKPVSRLIRFIAHTFIVVILLIALFSDQLIFQGFLPTWLDRIIAAVLWLWFINLFNFMDGIDGISGVETVSIGIGIACLAGLDEWVSLGQTYSIVVAGAGAGFLWWNWQPAKVFLGDVGSIPLGLLIGWLLLTLAVNGYWLQAIILPLYYFVDATLTLLQRLGRGEKFWEAHKRHYYQQAVQKGMSHSRVAASILLGNTILVVLAVTSTHAPVTGMIGAIAVIFVMLLYFKTPLNR